MEIKPVDMTVKSLLGSNFYKIPRFQRPYSWDRENIEEFWNDAIVADTKDYFIGSFVVHEGTAQYAPLQVVDGQQRLTTITILLAAVRDELDAQGSKQKAKGIQQLIERPDFVDDKPAFVLQTETSYPYFHEFIQKHGLASTQAEIGSEEQSLKQAYDHLRTRLSEQTSSINNSTSTSVEKKKKEIEAYLEGVRNKALRLQLILITLRSEDDAYLIFETLNTRGKDLTVSDLVKNHFTRLLRPTNKGVDTARDKWKAILDVFEASKFDIDINRFLHHAWLSKNPYIGEKILFKEIRRKITKTNANQTLDELLSDAKIYRTIFEPESKTWNKEETEIQVSLRALQIFRVIQPAPLLIALLRAELDNQISLRQLKAALSTLENFHFMFTAMTAQRTGGGTGKMYAQFAREIVDAKDTNARGRILTALTKKFRERTPKQGEFEDGVRNLRFSNENTKQKSLVRYLLMRLDQHSRSHNPIDYDKMNIEHIASQHPVSGSAVSRMAEIGNLILVPESLNGEQLKNKPFTEKLSLMNKYGVPTAMITKISTAKWGDAEIDKRSNAIAELAYEKIFRF